MIGRRPVVGLALALTFSAPALSGGVPGVESSERLSAQTLGERVGDADGTVAFRIGLRDGIRVCRDGVTMNRDRHRGDWNREEAGTCSSDFAEVVMEVSSGRVDVLEVEPWEGEVSVRGALDLGPADPEEAAEFLTGLAAGAGPPSSRRAAEHGLMASVLLEGVVVWPRLLGVARSRDIHSSVRRSALFWTSQVAAENVTGGIRELATDATEDQEIRDAAVFALSQRPAEESIPALMDVVRSAPHQETRRSALFWLAQQDDPRVADFFEEILAGG
jgi:hypothetical protein